MAVQARSVGFNLRRLFVVLVLGIVAVGVAGIGYAVRANLPAKAVPVQPITASQRAVRVPPPTAPTAPPATGFPTAANTGVQPGVALRSETGEITVTTPGAVISNLNLTGMLRIQADNVTIRNVRINWWTNLDIDTNPAMIYIPEGYDNVTIEDCEITGANIGVRAILSFGDNTVVRRCNIHSLCQAIYPYGSFTIQDNYIHNLSDVDADCHVDGVIVSSGGNGLIRHNSITFAVDQTCSVCIWAELGNTNNILVDNNLLGGGSYTIYAEQKSPWILRGVRFTNNRFTTSTFPNVGYWGIWYPNRQPPDLVCTGNVIHETGAPANC